MAGEFSNWFTLSDQSETNMVLMSAEGVYKKSIFKEISVLASPPPALNRRRGTADREFGKGGSRNSIMDARNNDHGVKHLT